MVVSKMGFLLLFEMNSIRKYFMILLITHIHFEKIIVLIIEKHKDLGIKFSQLCKLWKKKNYIICNKIKKIKNKKHVY